MSKSCFFGSSTETLRADRRGRRRANERMEQEHPYQATQSLTDCEQCERDASARPAPGEIYKRPSRRILEVLHAPAHPRVSFSPTYEYVALLKSVRYPSVAELARPALGLAGLRINPRNNGPRLAPRNVGLTLRRLDGENEVRVLLPHGARISYPCWSPDGRHFAFTNTTEDVIELWVGDAATGGAHKVEGIRLSDAYGGPFDWMPDGRTLLVRLIPQGRGEAPVAPPAPSPRAPLDPFLPSLSRMPI